MAVATTKQSNRRRTKKKTQTHLRSRGNRALDHRSEVYPALRSEMAKQLREEMYARAKVGVRSVTL